jgi:thioester reductase-like protein
VIAVVAERLRLPHVNPDVPFARLGVDSLGCIELAADVEAALGLHVPVDAVTECTTIRSLCEAITADRPASAFDLMRADAVLPADVRPHVGRVFRPGFIPLTTARHILLTGATGFLGAELLRRLLARTGARLTCLARAAVSLPHDPARVDIVQGNLALARAGLSDDDWQRLAGSVDCICHVGASINWIGSYEALRSVNVLGTRELLRLAAETGASFHFISSLSVCYPTQRRAVDESFDALGAIEGLHFGYAQTKAVAESLVREAAARGLHTRIYRPALITGDSRTGRFNPDDMLTSLIAGCVHMGAAPDLDWRLDGLPVDSVTDLIIGLSNAPDATVHLVHPRPRHWRECVLWMRLYGYDVTLVPYREWTARLRHAAADHPLWALRSFFLDERDGGLTIPELHEESRRPCVEARRSAAIISTLGADIPALDAALLDRYFTAFIRRGKLPPPSKCLPPEGGSHMIAGGESLPEGGRHMVVGIPSLPPSPSESPWLPPLGARKIAEQLLLEIGCDTSNVTVTPLAATDSIISELTAWRSGGATGLFAVGADGRWYVLKVKPHSDEAHAVGLALAGICGEDLADAYAAHGRGLGLDGGHERELTLYREADLVGRRYMPHAVATFADESTRTWAVLLEHISDASLVDSVDRPGEWTRDCQETAIDGVAALHAAWHDRIDKLGRQPWIGQLRTTASMQTMTPLWRALAEHAAPMFTAWTDSSFTALHHDLIDRIDAWRPALDRLPQTLIHNDFNPRNICLRDRDGRPALCAFDWELATIGAPVRDLAEFLCFVLPRGVDRDVVGGMLERHRRAFTSRARVNVDRDTWRAAFAAALCELLVDRLSVYAMVHRVRSQSFLPRVLRTWRTLYAMSDDFRLKAEATRAEATRMEDDA